MGRYMHLKKNSNSFKINKLKGEGLEKYLEWEINAQTDKE
jgi:hypothetical protein